MRRNHTREIGRLPVELNVAGTTIRFSSTRGGKLTTLSDPETQSASVSFAGDRLAEEDTLRIEIVNKKTSRS